jgi:hypothetical protein
MSDRSKRRARIAALNDPAAAEQRAIAGRRRRLEVQRHNEEQVALKAEIKAADERAAIRQERMAQQLRDGVIHSEPSGRRLSRLAILQLVSHALARGQ